MWPIPSLEDELITISFSPTNLVLSHIQKTKSAPTPYLVRAYKNIALHDLELEGLVLYNPSKIKKIISEFLTTNQKQNSFIAFSLQGPTITEQLISSPTSTINETYFGVKKTGFTEKGYHYMYPHDNGTFVFYTYAVPRSLLLQYQLLAIAAHLNLTTITTQRMALFNVYKYIFGPTFRRTQLAIDMHLHNNMIEHLISDDLLKKIVTIGPSISDACEFLSLATICGLFIQGTEDEKC